MPQPETSEAVALAELLHEADNARLIGSIDVETVWLNLATAVLAAGYVSPDRLASLLTEARAEAWEQGLRAGHHESGLVFRTDDSSHMHSTPNPYRPGGAR